MRPQINPFKLSNVISTEEFITLRELRKKLEVKAEARRKENIRDFRDKKKRRIVK